MKLWDTECPACGKEMDAVIHLGFPGRICPDETCAIGVGLAFIAAEVWWDGMLIRYRGGFLSYLRAMWTFLFGTPEVE